MVIYCLGVRLGGWPNPSQSKRTGVGAGLPQPARAPRCQGEKYSAEPLREEKVPSGDLRTWKENLSLPETLPSREKSIL
jgi:hypothetical protein